MNRTTKVHSAVRRKLHAEPDTPLCLLVDHALSEVPDFPRKSVYGIVKSAEISLGIKVRREHRETTRARKWFEANPGSTIRRAFMECGTKLNYDYFGEVCSRLARLPSCHIVAGRKGDDYKPAIAPYISFLLSREVGWTWDSLRDAAKAADCYTNERYLRWCVRMHCNRYKVEFPGLQTATDYAKRLLDSLRQSNRLMRFEEFRAKVERFYGTKTRDHFVALINKYQKQHQCDLVEMESVTSDQLLEYVRANPGMGISKVAADLKVGVVALHRVIKRHSRTFSIHTVGCQRRVYSTEHYA